MNDVYHEIIGPLGGYGLLCVRLVAGGWFWVSAFDDLPENNRTGRFVDRLGRAMALGVVVNLLPSLMLASIQQWSPTADWSGWGLLTILGFLAAWRKGGITIPFLWRGAAAVLVVWLAGSIFVLLPVRSEWLAGGWDPGIYQNNAFVISRDHGLLGRPESIYSEMSEEEIRLFMRTDGRYHEAFPATPVRLESGAMPLYFFHLTPVCGAWFHRMGGFPLLFRLPALLAVWTLFPLLALYGQMGLAGWKRWAGLAPWLTSPLWWYHHAIPTSEMLYVLILVSGLLFYVRAVRDRCAWPWGAILMLFLAVVNHLNAVVLLGFLLLFGAALESAGRVPGRVPRMIGCFSALALAVAWNLHFAQITILRLEEKDRILPLMVLVWAVCLIGSLLLARRAAPFRIPPFGNRVAKILGVCAGVVIVFAALGSGMEWTRPWLFRGAAQLPWAGPVLDAFLRTIPFQGTWSMIWAGTGFIAMTLDRKPEHAELKAMTFALGAIVLALLIAPGIAAIYPWALRRYVVFLLPFLALAQTFAVIHLSERRPFGRRMVSWALAAVILAGLLHGAVISRSAARVGDYRGLGRVVFELNEVIQPGDVVVADDPRWGTPLLLVGGHEVISGRRLWRSEDPDYQASFMNVLRRIRDGDGRRVLWLTSTERGLDLYPVGLEHHTELIYETRFSYRTVHHGTRARSYRQREHHRVFQFHVWDGGFE